MNIRMLLLIALSVFSGCVSSAIISRINSETSSGEGSGFTAEYQFTISAWTPDSSANPCFGDPSCEIVINHIHRNSGLGSRDPAGKFEESCVSTSATMNDLKKCLMGKVVHMDNPSSNIPYTAFALPYSGMVFHSGEVLTSECVGLFYGSNSIYHLLPGSSCGIAPSPTYSCKLPASINLDHGSIPSDQINGAITTQNISLNCTGNMSLKLALEGTSNGMLSLGNSGINSTISIDSKEITDNGINLNLKSGVNNFIVKSTLSTSGKSVAGKYSGNGILILAVQ